MSHLTALFDHIPGMLLVITRLTGLVLFAPFFSASVIPPRVKGGLFVLLGVVTYPLVAADHFGPSVIKLEVWTLAPLMAIELGIGMVIGYLASLPMVAIQIGGLLAGQQMGMGFAKLYNPATDVSANILSQVLNFMMLGGILALGGLEAMVEAVLHSFRYIEVGGMAMNATLVDMVTGMLLAACDVALRIATPVLAVVYLQSVAMGYLSKASPQLNILSLGFPMRILFGFTIIAMSLGAIDAVSVETWVDSLADVFGWIERGGH